MPDARNLERAEISQAGAISVAGLDHLVLRVADLDRAIKFYRDVLGGELEVQTVGETPWASEMPQMPGATPDKVMHAAVRIGDTVMLASDGECKGKPNFQGFALSLTTADAIRMAEEL